MTEPRVLREDDPAVPALLGDGWATAHTSWGARLAAPVGVDGLRALVAAAEGRGYAVGELGPGDDAAVVALEEANRADYPGGPATAPSPRTAGSMAADRAAGTRWFGARHGGEVVAVTAIRADGERAETDFTSVARSHRRRGLAAAVKAASVLTLAADGVTLFGTGGADENAASLAMNRRVGYRITERWLTLSPPR